MALACQGPDIVIHCLGSDCWLQHPPVVAYHTSQANRLNIVYYWRASEASKTLSGLFNRELRYIYMWMCVIVRMSLLSFDLYCGDLRLL